MYQKLALLLATSLASSAWAYQPLDPSPLYTHLGRPGSCSFEKCFDISTVMEEAGKVSFESQQGLLELFKTRNEAIRRKMLLLPHFNLRTYEFAIPTPVDYVANLLPFIFPSHWYKRSESKLNAKAQEYSYISTVANQRSAAQGLYLAAHQELMARKVLENHIAFVTTLYFHLKKRVLSGEIPAEDAEQLSAFLSKLQSDHVLQANMVVDQTLDLAALLASVSQESNPGPVEIELPDLSKSTKLDFKQVRKAALEVSPEIKTFDYLIAASWYTRKARLWDFLTPDGTHADNGFGFAIPSSLRIHDAERKQIEIQKKEFEINTTKTLVQTQQQVTNASKIYVHAMAIETSIHSVLKTLLINLDTNKRLDVDRIIHLLRDNLAAQIMKNSAAHSFLQAEGLVKRLVMDHKNYAGIASQIPTSWVNIACYMRKENRAIKRDLELGELQLPDKIEFKPEDTAWCIR